MKLCNRCKTAKHANAFRKGEWVCKQCQSRGRRKLSLMSDYGLTFEEFSTLLDQQQGRCAICRDEFEGEPMVDHNHKTRKVRGLLCHHCNTGLGLFRDDPVRLSRAYDYLDKGGKGI